MPFLYPAIELGVPSLGRIPPSRSVGLRMIRRFRVKARLLFAFAFMLASLVGFGWHILSAKWAVRTEMAHLEDLSASVATASRLIHTLQQERGTSSTYLNSKGAQMRDQLAAIRRSSDDNLSKARASFAAVAGATGEFAEAMNEAWRSADMLAAKRQAIDTLALSPAESFAFYTDLIGRLLDGAAAVAKLSSRGDVTAALQNYVIFMRGKEQAGQERATGAGGLAAGGFDHASFARFVGLSSAQGQLFGVFEKAAAPAQRRAFAQAASEPVNADVERMRQTIRAAGPTVAIPGIAATTWFAATTARIDILKKIEDLLAADLSAMTGAIRAAATNELLLTGLGAILVFAASIAAVLGMGRSITNPIRELSITMTNLAEGRLDIEVPGRTCRDEIGDMARAVEVLRTHALDRLRLQEEQRAAELRAAEEQRRAEAEELARQAAIEEQAFQQRTAAMHTLADQFEDVVGEIVNTVSSASNELEATADSLTHNAGITHNLTGAVAAASADASTDMQSVAAATEEMASSVADISRQLHESAAIATRAVEQADKTDVRISTLADAAARIGAVVNLITAIAEQTNLLALNATIEAARAGAAGKGFAVVASEVKALAGQTAKATDEIGQQVASIQTITRDSVADIKAVGEIIGRIAEIAAATSTTVDGQSAATREIARNVQRAAQGTAKIAADIGAVERGAGETGAASEQLLAAARSLARENGQLKTEVDKFLITVRTGPADRRRRDDPNYTGPERRADRQAAGRKAS
jgi:methyl-accepting chemotaxis protein